MLKLINDYAEARTLFAFMFYATFCYLILAKVPIPPELNTIVSSLMGYWFGSKNTKNAVDIDGPATDKKTLISLLIVSLLFLQGCAYYSKTEMHIHAKKATIPLNLVPIRLEDGQIDLIRETQTRGINQNGS